MPIWEARAWIRAFLKIISFGVVTLKSNNNSTLLRYDIIMWFDMLHCHNMIEIILLLFFIHEFDVVPLNLEVASQLLWVAVHSRLFKAIYTCVMLLHINWNSNNSTIWAEGTWHSSPSDRSPHDCMDDGKKTKNAMDCWLFGVSWLIAPVILFLWRKLGYLTPTIFLVDPENLFLLLDVRLISFRLPTG